ncbi:MAG: hypothetical protein OXR66_00455 [Candidatus Woesearchaeota archaeon]|nr:hypothetical protein [Candidatus Woesearchaeota archaeon]
MGRARLLDYLVLLFFLLSCTPYTPSLSEQVDSLAASCCGEITFTLPENTELYTTTEAVCLKKSARLYCGTCDCLVEAASLAAPGPERVLTCSLSTAQCAP